MVCRCLDHVVQTQAVAVPSFFSDVTKDFAQLLLVGGVSGMEGPAWRVRPVASG